MKYRLCVLVVLLQGPLVAQPASPPQTPGVLADPGVFSTLKSLPIVNPALVRSDTGREAQASGLLAPDLAFPSRARTPPQAAGAAAVRSAVRETFRFDPLSYSPPGSDEEAGAGSIMVMEPIQVPGSKMREMADALDFAEVFRRASAFHPTTGGRLGSFTLGDYDVDLGMWRHESLIDEDAHVGIPRLVVDLVRVQW